MSKASWLILALLVLWAHPSHAVQMTQCPDGVHYRPVNETDAWCPPRVNVTGTEPGSTTATITGSTTLASGSVYASVRLDCTLLQWRDVVGGLGDEASGSDSTVTDGTFSVSLTGLAESTSYCVLVAQYVPTLGRPSNVYVVELTTSAETPSETGDEITGGDDRFYDAVSGSDANSGLTHATRQQNYPQDTSILPTSTDMWLLSGSVWTNRPLNLNHGGTSDNYAEFGTYYMDDTTPRKISDGIKGVGTTDTKAEIRGGLTTSCLVAGTCVYPASSGFPRDGGMESMWDALVSLSAVADYTHVQNIKLNLSRYACFNASGLGHTNPGSLHHVIVDGVDCENTGFGNIQMTDGIRDIVVRNSTIDNGNTCEVLRLRGLSSDTSACATAGWPNGIVAVRSPNARVLFEHNVVTRNFGEGLMCAFIIEYCIIRNNVVSGVWSDSVGVDSARYSVFEGNIVIGNDKPVTSYYAGLTVDDSGGIGSAILNGSETTGAYAPIGNVYRGNLSVGVNSCFYMRQFPGVALNISNQVYGNTCVTGRSNVLYPSYLVNTDNISTTTLISNDYQNNVVWASNRSAASLCNIITDADNNFADNHWSSNPTDPDCGGAGDTSGAPGLTLSTLSDWGVFDHETWPTFADANPAGGSVLIGAGTALTSTILDIANYGFAWEQISEVLDGSLTEAEWECALCVDALGATRANPPSKGAVE